MQPILIALASHSPTNNRAESFYVEIWNANITYRAASHRRMGETGGHRYRCEPVCRLVRASYHPAAVHSCPLDAAERRRAVGRHVAWTAPWICGARTLPRR